MFFPDRREGIPGLIVAGGVKGRCWETRVSGSDIRRFEFKKSVTEKGLLTSAAVVGPKNVRRLTAGEVCKPFDELNRCGSLTL